MALYPSPLLYPSTTLYPLGPVVGDPLNVGHTVAVPSLFRQAWRTGWNVTYSIAATLGGVAAVSGLLPVGGRITDTTKPGVRRMLDVDLAPEVGLFDKLSPIGTTLTVTAHVRFTNRRGVDIPMGVFDVDSETLSEGDGGISLTAPDKWVRIQRANFLGPQASVKGRDVRLEIKALIQGALGVNEPVVITASAEETVGALTYEDSREKAIIDLADSIGAWVYFDRDGVCTIAEQPGAATADWTIDSTPTGVLIDLDRERDRADTYNVVIVESTHPDSPRFPTQYVWDNDEDSPTFAGPGVGVSSTKPSATVAGPFGLVPYTFRSPTIGSINAARATGKKILARTKGLAEGVSIANVPNPAIDAFQVIDVLPPRERRDLKRVVERHVVDTVTHPLRPDLDEKQQIEGRSTRAEEFPTDEAL